MDKILKYELNIYCLNDHCNWKWWRKEHSGLWGVVFTILEGMSRESLNKIKVKPEEGAMLMVEVCMLVNPWLVHMMGSLAKEVGSLYTT